MQSQNDRLNGQSTSEFLAKRKSCPKKKRREIVGSRCFSRWQLETGCMMSRLVHLPLLLFITVSGLFFKQVQTVWLALCSVFWALYWISVESPPSSSIWSGFYFFFSFYGAIINFNVVSWWLFHLIWVNQSFLPPPLPTPPLFNDIFDCLCLILTKKKMKTNSGLGGGEAENQYFALCAFWTVKKCRDFPTWSSARRRMEATFSDNKRNLSRKASGSCRNSQLMDQTCNWMAVSAFFYENWNVKIGRRIVQLRPSGKVWSTAAGCHLTFS